MSTAIANKPCVITELHIPIHVCPESYRTCPDADKPRYTTSAAYLAIVLACIEAGRPVAYPNDVLVTDRAYMEGTLQQGTPIPEQFVYILGESSTHFVALGAPQAVERLLDMGRDPKDYLYIWDGEALTRTDLETAKLFLLMADVVNDEPRRFTATIQTPTYDQLIASLPYELRSGNTRDHRKISDVVRMLHQREMEVMLREASIRTSAMISMSTFVKEGNQWIAWFNVRDQSMPYRSGEINFHGQNLSQTPYCGALTVSGDPQWGYIVSSNH